jgi:predicted amidohydrolase YtcJ
MREWTFGLVLAALAAASPVLAADADAIYFGGTILTIDKKAPTAGAVAIKGGLITAVGDQETVTAAEKGADTEMVDLRGKTLIPGFVDAHSHMAGVGLQAVSANLLPPPDGPVTSIADLQKVMREFIATSPKPKAYGVAIGLNYDDSQLAEKRHPTREELDAISTDIPIVIVHQSGHLAVMNTKALEKAGITADSPNPPGGVIRREADGKTPNGVLEEMAHLANTPKLLPKFTPAQAMELVEAAQNIYVANGFTTAQEGRASPGLIAMLRGAAAAQALVIDVVAYADLAASSDHLEGADSFEDTVDMSEAPQPGVAPPSNDPSKIVVSRDYVDHFRVGGVKLTFDGSPQGKTAWFTKPYYVPPEGQKADYVGYPAFPKPGEAQSWVDMAYRNNWQLMIHANGDAAIDEVIKTVGQAQKTYGGGDRRTVLIHGQYLRADGRISRPAGPAGEDLFAGVGDPAGRRGPMAKTQVKASAGRPGPPAAGRCRSSTLVCSERFGLRSLQDPPAPPVSTASAKASRPGRMFEPSRQRRTALQRVGARVAHPIDAVAETHQPIAAVERRLEPGAGVLRLADGVQHLDHRAGRAAVQRTLQGADPGQHRRGQAGAGRGDHPRGEGRGVQAVVADRDQIGVAGRRPRPSAPRMALDHAQDVGGMAQGGSGAMGPAHAGADHGRGEHAGAAVRRRATARSSPSGSRAIRARTASIGGQAPAGRRPAPRPPRTPRPAPSPAPVEASSAGRRKSRRTAGARPLVGPAPARVHRIAPDGQAAGLAIDVRQHRLGRHNPFQPIGHHDLVSFSLLQ